MTGVHQTDDLTMTDLCTQVFAWSSRNFGDKQASDLGIIEELGELTHGILKRYQSIRGFDKDEVFYPHIEDAFADMGIYLLNMAGHFKFLIAHNPYDASAEASESRRLIASDDRFFACQVMSQIGTLMFHIIRCDNDPREAAETGDAMSIASAGQTLWNWLVIWSAKYGFDYRAIVTKTWLKIRQRDWEKNRESAHLAAP